MKLECRAFPTLSTMAEVVMDDSMQRMAVMASSLVTSFLNISLACAATLAELKSRMSGEGDAGKSMEGNIPWANRIKLSSMRTVVLAASLKLVKWKI